MSLTPPSKGRYAKFYNLTRLYPGWDDNKFIVDNDEENYHNIIREHLRYVKYIEDDGKYLDGDILFIGSTYPSRQEYGFVTVTDKGTNFVGGEFPKLDT